MLYHPNSPFYRQFLTTTSRKAHKKVEQMVSAQAPKSMPNINPGSVGL